MIVPVFHAGYHHIGKRTASISHENRDAAAAHEEVLLAHFPGCFQFSGSRCRQCPQRAHPREPRCCQLIGHPPVCFQRRALHLVGKDGRLVLHDADSDRTVIFFLRDLCNQKPQLKRLFPGKCIVAKYGFLLFQNLIPLFFGVEILHVFPSCVGLFSPSHTPFSST